ncbi:MAG TPA: B12-binding domain-containing radical SAM protein, partial [Verrucomicrobiae bacterium]|nr:B12-binding domain-containing radical SAM protein [Verrucomicrobiae bacterium]
MNALNILMVYPAVPETFWSLTHALRFFGKRTWSPPLGLLTVASMLPKEYSTRLVDLNVDPDWEKHLPWADYVFVSAMDVQRDSARKVIDRAKAAGKKVVVGGPLFTSDPGPFADVDHLVLNEAEVTLPGFLEDLAKGEAKHCYTTTEFADVSASPVPSYQILDASGYGAMSIQFSRGCPYQCEFCDVTALFGRRPRSKTAAQILTELDNIYNQGWRGKIYFVDDNIMGNRPYLKKELLPAIIKWRKGKKGISFHTQITMNLADDQEMIEQMYEAGFDWIFIGIETPDQASLAEANKKQNMRRNLVEQIRLLQRNGLQVQAGFIVGFDNDPLDIFQRQYDFIQTSGIVMAMVGLLQAPLGTQLYKRLEKEGRIIGVMSGNNVIDDTNIITRMDREYLKTQYRGLVRALYEPANYYARIKTFLAEYKEPREHPPVNLAILLATLRCFFWMGLVRPGRLHFWRVFLWACLHKRDSIQNFIGLA